MFVCLTNIDAISGVVCTAAPMAAGPALPQLTGWKFDFAAESKYPIQLKSDGSYKTAPLYYGACDNNAATDIPGVVSVLTQAKYELAREQEMAARPAASASIV